MLAPRSYLSLTNTSAADEVPVAAGRAQQQQQRRHRNSLYAATCLRALRSLCSAVTHEALHCSWRAQGGPRGTPFPNDLRIFDCWHSKFWVRHEKTQAKSISWVLPIQATQKGHSASQPQLVCQTVGCYRLTIILIVPKFLETLFRFRLSTSSGTCPPLLCRSLAPVPISCHPQPQIYNGICHPSWRRSFPSFDQNSQPSGSPHWHLAKSSSSLRAS